MQLKFGKITAIDFAKGLARVTFEENDNLVTRFLPMSMPKTLQDKFIIPFDVNEHVWCIMDEHCEDGVIGGAIYDAKNQPPSGSAEGETMIKFLPNLLLKYSRNSQTLSIEGTGVLNIEVSGNASIKCSNATVQAQLKATIEATTQIDLKAPVINAFGVLNAGAIATSTGPGFSGGGNATITGDLTSTGKLEGAEVKEGTIRLGTHKHTGVQTGGGVSGTPTP